MMGGRHRERWLTSGVTLNGWFRAHRKWNFDCSLGANGQITLTHFQEIMVVVFVKTNIQSKVMNTITMLLVMGMIIGKL